MAGRDYLKRQTLTLLQMAKATRDPDKAAALTRLAADLTSKIADGSATADISPAPPDVDTGDDRKRRQRRG